MSKKVKTQHTLRDIPELTDHRLRETAAVENISLNQATLQALQRGLGTGAHSVRYRSLHSLLQPKNEVDLASWRSALAEMDRVNPEDWQKIRATPSQHESLSRFLLGGSRGRPSS